MGTIRRSLSRPSPTRLSSKGSATARGRGRDDYPVSVLWGVAVLTPLLRHPSHEACLAELRRNPSLRRLLGVEAEAQIPHHWNLSRFLDVLGHPVHLAAMHDCFDRMVQRLGGVVPDLGRRLAGDATALKHAGAMPPARRRRRGWDCPNPPGVARSISMPRAASSGSSSGSATSSICLVESSHEVALAYRITTPAVGDNEMIAPLLEQVQATLARTADSRRWPTTRRPMTRRCIRCCYAAGIKPLIQNPRPVEGQTGADAARAHDGDSNMVHDEAGTIYCYDTAEHADGAPPDGLHRATSRSGGR